jgi:N-hydroxyarylamine O-acetyltransferase
MPLVDGAEATAPDGAAFRLIADPDHGWLLLRNGHPATTDGRTTGDGWQPQYSFTLEQVATIDLEMSNHWTSTRHGTRFTTLSVVSACLPSGFASLTDRNYTRHNGDQHVEAVIESATAYRLRLNFVFGIVLDEVEVNGLGLFE